MKKTKWGRKEIENDHEDEMNTTGENETGTTEKWNERENENEENKNDDEE